MEAEKSNKNVIVGRNPVMEALRSDREIEKLVVGKGAEGSIKKIVGMAKEKKIPITMRTSLPWTEWQMAALIRA